MLGAVEDDKNDVDGEVGRTGCEVDDDVVGVETKEEGGESLKNDWEGEELLIVFVGDAIRPVLGGFLGGWI